MGATSCHPASFTARSLEKISIVQPGALTRDVGIVRWRADAHSLGSASKGVTEGLCELFDLVGNVLALATGSKDLVQHYHVVRGAAGSLDHVVRLQEEIPHALFGHAAIDNGAGLEISTESAAVVGVHVLVASWVEARMVALADDDDGQVGLL